MKIQFLGGIGEIGANATLYTSNNSQFLVDYGIKFPRFKELGIGKIMASHDEVPSGITLILTHIHEDHIGGLAEIVNKLTKIYAPEIAINYIQKKWPKFPQSLELIKYDYNDIIEIDSETNIYPFETFHSTPSTYGLKIVDRSNDHSIIHLSDFKSNRKTIFKNINKNWQETLTKETYFLCDSTNALSSKQFDCEEDEISQEIMGLLKSSKGNIFITLFASNIERTNNIISICNRLNLPYSFLGESFNFYQGIQTERNNFHEVDDFSRKVYFVTGSQGEKFSYLWRLSRDQAEVSLKPEDSIIFSSRIIPGNESIFNHMLNLISLKTVNLFFDGPNKLHCSGHAYFGDVEIAINDLSPTCVIPIHGETVHLQVLAKKLSERLNQRAIALKGQDNIQIGNLQITTSPELSNDLYFDTHANRKMSKSDIKARRKLAEKGIVFFDSKTSKIFAYGLPFCEQIVEAINSDLMSNKSNKLLNIERIRRRLEEKIGYIPVIIDS